MKTGSQWIISDYSRIGPHHQVEETLRRCHRTLGKFYGVDVRWHVLGNGYAGIGTRAHIRTHSHSLPLSSFILCLLFELHLTISSPPGVRIYFWVLHSFPFRVSLSSLILCFLSSCLPLTHEQFSFKSSQLNNYK